MHRGMPEQPRLYSRHHCVQRDRSLMPSIVAMLLTLSAAAIILHNATFNRANILDKVKEPMELKNVKLHCAGEHGSQCRPHNFQRTCNKLKSKRGYDQIR